MDHIVDLSPEAAPYSCLDPTVRQQKVSLHQRVALVKVLPTSMGPNNPHHPPEGGVLGRHQKTSVLVSRMNRIQLHEEIFSHKFTVFA